MFFESTRFLKLNLASLYFSTLRDSYVFKATTLGLYCILLYRNLIDRYGHCLIELDDYL